MSGEDPGWGGATLIGKKVRIRAVSAYGSARLLHGLTGVVIASHPIAPNWVRVRLDFNLVTPYREWSIPKDRLTVRDSDTAMDEPNPDESVDTPAPDTGLLELSRKTGGQLFPREAISMAEHNRVHIPPRVADLLFRGLLPLGQQFHRIDERVQALISCFRLRFLGHDNSRVLVERSQMTPVHWPTNPDFGRKRLDLSWMTWG